MIKYLMRKMFGVREIVLFAMKLWKYLCNTFRDSEAWIKLSNPL